MKMKTRRRRNKAQRRLKTRFLKLRSCGAGSSCRAWSTVTCHLPWSCLPKSPINTCIRALLRPNVTPLHWRKCTQDTLVANHRKRHLIPQRWGCRMPFAFVVHTRLVSLSNEWECIFYYCMYRSYATSVKLTRWDCSYESQIGLKYAKTILANTVLLWVSIIVKYTPH